jgi:hypothetical protein
VPLGQGDPGGTIAGPHGAKALKLQTFEENVAGLGFVFNDQNGLHGCGFTTRGNATLYVI